ncbi:LuxR family transcriptional regulator [Microbacterium sp. SS28]|uniref:helix-turn-helix transcriptional regulator n=1 Tax=Microbacterium sp. SS28 TaxID=2919948 RepID=UPI001FA95AD9|nr:LuxR C-terminal-related transcriptional regulator [Microbacterium sp. SS28]
MSRVPHRIFVGRGALVEELARAARDGETRLVAGPAGIGRSHLLQHVADLVERDRPVCRLAATRAAASMPLGLFLPVIDRVESAFEAATRLRLTLVERMPLITVDDAHLLDAASAAVLLDLARADVPLLLSVRDGQPIDEAVQAIERHHAPARMSLAPLSDGELARLVRSRVAAMPDPGLMSMVRQWSEGIPQYAEETLQGLIDADRIAYEVGTAYVVGAGAPRRTVPASGSEPRVSSAALHAARLTALAQSLPLAIMRGLATAQAVEEAETAGLLRFRRAADAIVLEPRHPWLGESLVADLPVAARLSLIQELVDAHPTLPPDPRLAGRVVLWRIELGLGVRVDDLLDAIAGSATVAPAEAEALVDAAIARVRQPADTLKLATLLTHLQRLDDAEALLSGLAAADLPAEVGRRRDIVHAFVAMFPANDPARAVELLRRHIDDPLARAHLASAFLQLGDIRAAVRMGASVLDEAEAPTEAQAHAALALSAALVHGGRIADYEALRSRRNELISRAADLLPQGMELARIIDESALSEAREALDAAQALARGSYEGSLAGQDDGMRAQHSHQLARIALERGAPDEALPLAVGAVVADGAWALAFRARTEATLIEALALAGRRDEAAEHLARAGRRPRSPLYDLDLARAAAVTTAAGGHAPDAAERLAQAAVHAVARGQFVRGRVALDQAVRYGSDAAARALLRLRPSAGDAALAGSQALAHGWLDRDAIALDARARDLAERRLLWRALETAALAVVTGADAATLAVLRARCPSLRSPVVPDAPATVLTARESEIAGRAAAGRTDAEIAAETGLSIRTVQTHLSNIYHKLGIRSRTELARRLEPGIALRSPTGT